MAQRNWDVRDRRVVITGGSSGLGLAMARALVQASARVVITGRRERQLDEAARTLRGETGDVWPLVMDVRDEASVRRGIERVASVWGGIDVLVNNAGIGMRTVNPSFMSDPQPFWDVPADKFEAVIDTNLTGYFRVASAVVPLMLAAGHGKIVNISMNHATMRRRGFVPYGPSRAGAESLSLIMAEDLRPHGITVNMLLPGGATLTGMIPETVPLEVRASFLSPDVMAKPILYLSSAASDGITGQRLVATEFDSWLRARPNESGGVEHT